MHRIETILSAAALLVAASACTPSTTNATIAGSAASVESAADTPKRVAPTVHTVTASPEGIVVNAYLVETPEGVVAIDSALTVSDAKKLREKLDSLKKPLLAVLLTHGHPDHYNGVTALVEGRPDTPIYSTAEVAKVIAADDAKKEALWKPMFKEQWPDKRTFPNHEIASGTKLDLGGLSFTVFAVGPGESHADSYWVLDADRRYVFVGDVVLHGVHAYVSDGHTTPWLETLARLRRELDGAGVLYPGHGPAGGVELLDWQTRYLESYRASVERLREGREKLSDDAKKTLIADMKQKYPDAALDFLIGLGADAVASELARAH
ncbi:MAG: MBL fold metallo-hydrolase [Polyangiaceae bacterium]|nr:MBL fold metallo-hydrolase [Polyangiaceae bacterium]